MRLSIPRPMQRKLKTRFAGPAWRRLTARTCVLLLSVSPMAHAEVSDICRAAFSDSGAMPFTDDCRLQAGLFTPTLGNYFCGDTTEIAEYCSTLPPYDESSEDETDNADGTDGDTDGSGEDTGSDGGTDSADSDSGNDGNPEPLSIYEENSADGSGEITGEEIAENTFQTFPGVIEYIFGTGWQFSDNPALAHYGLVSAGVTLVNLTTSAQQARETCDSGLLFQNVYDAYLFTIPGDNELSQAFQRFSDYSDIGIPGCNVTLLQVGRGRFNTRHQLK